eukprot:CAMPEP_0194552142 /NCGR_PEP_ID=MMETSP0253-20130528/96576_1 /TAXON_ID=2966 /ORGANISM="Noctiluca scintillans" /LENGTH=323 /DNA_ID=CAMNT_0039399607 /DNA_START=2470 /DNA_END=3439 /DNA_ORIENTATION=-
MGCKAVDAEEMSSMPTSSAERFQRGHEAQGGHAPFEASLRVLRSMKTDQGFLQETANAGLSLRGEMSRRSVLRFTGYRLQTVNYHMFGLFGSKFSSASVEKVANDMTPAAVVHLRCPLCVFLQTSFRVCRHNFLDVVSFNHFPLRVGELVFKSACDLRVSLPPARLIPARGDILKYMLTGFQEFVVFRFRVPLRSLFRLRGDTLKYMLTSFQEFVVFGFRVPLCSLFRLRGDILKYMFTDTPNFVRAPGPNRGSRERAWSRRAPSQEPVERVGSVQVVRLRPRAQPQEPEQGTDPSNGLSGRHPQSGPVRFNAKNTFCMSESW